MTRLAWIPLLIASAAIADDSPRPIRFREDVVPILARNCIGCHNDRKAEGGLNLATLEAMKRGGKTLPGEAVVASDPDASYLIELLRPDAEPRMPFRLPPLREADIHTLEQWIREGASPGGVEDSTPLMSLVDPSELLPKIPPAKSAAEPATAVAYAPDGKLIAVARGAIVLLCEGESGREVARLAADDGVLTAVDFSANGKILYAAGGVPGRSGTVIAWDIPDRTRKFAVSGHKDSILDAALAPDGSILATAGYDRLVLLWDARDGKLVRTLKEHTDSVHSVAFSPDGSRIASASADRTIKVWETTTGRRLATLSEPTAEQYAVCFDAAGTRIIAAGADRTIHAWSVRDEAAELSGSVIAHEAAVIRFASAPDGQTLYSCGEDRTVRAWALPALSALPALPAQPDWPLAAAVSPDAQRLAIGRFDGSLAIVDLASRRNLVASIDPLAPQPDPLVKKAEGESAPPKPELVRPPSLNPPSLRGVVRGATTRLTLTGNGVGQADRVRFPEPSIQARILPSEKPDPNRLEIEVAIAPDARVGVHSFLVHTPLGTPAAQRLAVDPFPETAVGEPGGPAADPLQATLPATLVGAIDTPGDTDEVRFEAKAGQTMVFEVRARGLGSALDGRLSLHDASGTTLASTEGTDGGIDPVLTFTAATDGIHILRIADVEYGGSANHFYRILAGAFPRVDSVFPLGAAPGVAVEVELGGPNIAPQTRTTVVPAADARDGSLLAVAFSEEGGQRSFNARSVVVSNGPQAVLDRACGEPSAAFPIAAPGGVSARLGSPGEIHYHRFTARKGERWIIEVHGQRLGGAIDPVIEVADIHGRTIERAVLRPVSETNLTFRDHNAGGRTFRLTTWGDFAIGDTVLLGRELLRVVEMPRNPDDEILVEGLGTGRLNPGDRLGLLETTPEHHPSGQAFTKVEIHPAGTTFPPGGSPPIPVPYRNDDGGPGFGKDSRLTFDAPDDADYLVRVEDARALGGSGFAYHLAIRRPSPSFHLALSAENPTIPRGGSITVTASINRVDGFDAPVDITLEGLPPGVAASSTRIERGQYAADIVLSAAEDAPGSLATNWVMRGRTVPESSGGEPLEEVLDPGGPDGGWITVTSAPNLKVRPSTDRLVIRPGEQVGMSFAVERAEAFKGRVPIDVHNLPVGVRVLDIGLNGVLVTESQTERSVVLYAEPWVQPMERAFSAVGRCEAAGTEHSSPPITLVVEPR